jgi:hypothetical protein
MATPKFVTAGTTPFKEADMNKALQVDGTKIQVKTYYGRIRYNGATWEVVAAATADNAGIVTGDLAWSTDHLNITVSGFTNPPRAILTPVSTGTTPARAPMQSAASTNVQVQVYFFDGANPPAADTTEATDMDFNIFLIGF